MSDVDFILNRDDTVFLFTPCVESDTGTGEEMFIGEGPWNYVKNGTYNSVPILSGFAEMEGLFRIPLFESYKTRMNNKFADFLPAELEFLNKAQRNDVAAKVKVFYFGNEAVSEENILSYIDYFTDIMFAYPMLRIANLRASRGETIYSYLYQFLFVDENTPLVPFTSIQGANDCEQLNIVMEDSDLLKEIPVHTEEFIALRKCMREMWLDFITTGNPTPEDSSLPAWDPVNGYVSPYMAFNQTIKLKQSSLLKEMVRFWDSIYDEYYRSPVSPEVASTCA